MHAAFAAVGRFSVRHRWPVVVGWLLATILAAAFFPSLASVTKDNNTDFLPAGTPSIVAAKLAAPLQGSQLAAIPVVVSRSAGKLSDTDGRYLSRLSVALGRVTHVSAVKDLGRSADGQAEQLQVLAAVGHGQEGALQSVIAQLRATLARTAAPAGIQAHLAGQLATQVDATAGSRGTGGQVQALSVLFILVLLMVIFRSPLAPFVTLLPALLVTELAGPVIAETTKAGLQVSQLSQLMLIVLVLGAGTDYGLFLVFRVREELRAGLTPRLAVVRGIERVGESITFSAATVIAALLSLLAAQFGIYSSLGAPLAIGIFLMLLAALTLLPALLTILGRAVFWPADTRPGAGRVGLWSRLSGRIVAHPAVTLVAGITVFAGLAVVATGYTAVGFSTGIAAPAGSDSAAGNAALAAHFPASAANPTRVILRFPHSVWQNPELLATAQARLASSGLFTAVTGPTNPNGIALPPAELARLHAALGDPRHLAATPPPGLRVSAAGWRLYRSEANFISADGRTVQFLTSLTAGDPASTQALHAVPALRTAVTRVGHEVHAVASGVTGEAPGIYDVSHVSNTDLTRLVPLAILVIGVLLALVMRSLVAPLYLIASVALSYLAALGLAVLIFQDLGHSGGLTFLLPFLMFLFLLALGEDYNILVMTRIREEAHRLPLREAVRRALAATGTTVTSAGLVLAGTFGVFAIAGGSGSGGSQVRDIGTGLAAGILMDTFLVRTLLVPSTVVLLGRWNWWPSRLHQRPADAEPEREPVLAGP